MDAESLTEKSAGIRFKEIRDDHAEQIRDYISKEQLTNDYCQLTINMQSIYMNLIELAVEKIINIWR
jgi:hypothetical protein